MPVFMGAIISIRWSHNHFLKLQSPLSTQALWDTLLITPQIGFLTQSYLESHFQGSQICLDNLSLQLFPTAHPGILKTQITHCGCIERAQVYSAFMITWSKTFCKMSYFGSPPKRSCVAWHCMSFGHPVQWPTTKNFKSGFIDFFWFFYSLIFLFEMFAILDCSVVYIRIHVLIFALK